MLGWSNAAPSRLPACPSDGHPAYSCIDYLRFGADSGPGSEASGACSPETSFTRCPETGYRAQTGRPGSRGSETCRPETGNCACDRSQARPPTRSKNRSSRCP